MSRAVVRGWQVLRWFVVVSAALLFGYIGLTTEFGIDGFRLRSWILATATLTLVVWVYARWCEIRGLHKKGLAVSGLLMASTLATFLVADSLYNFSLNRWATPLPFSFDQTSQGSGLEIQLKLPRYRTADGGRNKPHSIIGGEVFGELVPPLLANDPVLIQKAIERRWVEYRLDEHGFRKTGTRWSDAKVVSLGDSFVFGSGIASEFTWVARLEAQGAAIYNLGEAGTAPPDQLVRLKEMRARMPNKTVTTILWMIFGGNDLDASRTEFGDDSSRMIEGTLAVGPLRGIEAIRDRAILSRVRRGALMPLRYPDAYWYQGHLMPAPMYESARLGMKWFYPPYIREAQRVEEDVLRDPELDSLRFAIEELSGLSEQAGWRVLVLYAPSAESLLGREFEGFPEVTSGAPLSDWLSKESARVGFEYLDLTEALRESSRENLPYFRDDTHWNQWGHEVVGLAVMNQLELLGWNDLFDAGK